MPESTFCRGAVAAKMARELIGQWSFTPTPNPSPQGGGGTNVH
jgi:hypothetical protein